MLAIQNKSCQSRFTPEGPSIYVIRSRSLSEKHACIGLESGSFNNHPECVFVQAGSHDYHWPVMFHKRVVLGVNIPDIRKSVLPN